jgi:hypothetical protein
MLTPSQVSMRRVVTGATVARSLRAVSNRAVNITLGIRKEGAQSGEDNCASAAGDHASNPHVSR